MSRNRKKNRTAEDRRQAEIQRRMAAAAENAERKKNQPQEAGAAHRKKKPKPERVTHETAQEPESVQTPRTRPASRRRAASQPYQPTKRYKTLRLKDAGDAGGDCRHYDVRYQPPMDIQELFDAIRNAYKNEHGTVYISTNLADAGLSNYQLSYSYAGGMFIRNEHPSKDKNAPLLADLLGRPVRKVAASGGWGAMDWFVSIYEAPENAADSYDPSEIMPGIRAGE